jgi:hypothetical protein
VTVIFTESRCLSTIVRMPRTRASKSVLPHHSAAVTQHGSVLTCSGPALRDLDVLGGLQHPLHAQAGGGGAGCIEQTCQGREREVSQMPLSAAGRAWAPPNPIKDMPRSVSAAAWASSRVPIKAVGS